MPIKIPRIKMRTLAPVLSITNENQGLGVVKGAIHKQSIPYANAEVCIFKRSNRALLWSTKSLSNGSYTFRNIAAGLECFVIAFDPDNQYNAVIQDKVVAK